MYTDTSAPMIADSAQESTDSWAAPPPTSRGGESIAA